MRVIAIGDIHGCYHTLVALLERIEYDWQSDTLIFLGDYIDRGSHGCEVVKYVRRLQERAGEDNVICLLGNHEDFAMKEKGQWYPLWERNGCATTLDSYARCNEAIINDVRWFESLPLVYEDEKYIFCHAGLARPKLADNTRHDILWDRHWIDWDDEPREKKVIFGHTPDWRTFKPYTTLTGDTCIDCGCVYGGNLCAMIWDGEEEPHFVLEAKHVDDRKWEPW